MTALLLLFLPLTASKVCGAGRTFTEKVCTITFRLDGQYPELHDLPVLVKLYRVAGVGEDGGYMALEAFSGLDFSSAGNEMTAKEWSGLSEQVSAIAKADHLVPAAETQVQKQPGEEYAVGQAQGLVAGMYLVEAESVQSGEYVYNFIPYLAVLPDSQGADTGDGARVYDVDTVLKPERQGRFGSLVIEKELIAYNAVLGGASFVFQVEAEKEGKSVYSDVVSLAFDAPGVKSSQIDGILAGAAVTVTEVYSGASYTAAANTEQSVTVTAEGGGGNPVCVHFKNTYDGRPNGGSGLVNYFRCKDGVWEMRQQKDSTESGK